MPKVRIFVASHKPGPRLGEGLYELIHVGRAVSSCQEAMAGMTGDDTGENISDLPRRYR